MHNRLTNALLIIFTISTARAQSGDDCGSLAAHATDYRTAKPAHKENIENAHFTREIEKLSSGKSSTVGGDLNFTLTTFPNHPRALISMMNLSLKKKTEKPVGAEHTVECYLQRAIKFQPDDDMVRMIHGVYLSKQGKKTDAIKELEIAKTTLGNNPNLVYNLGLLYFDVGNYEQSLYLAHEANRLGYPLQGLRRKLTSVGKWHEPIAPVITLPAIKNEN